MAETREGARADGAGAGDRRSPLRPLRDGDHRGWYVPRRLPHFDSPVIAQAVTFRLRDALPRGVAAARAGEGDEAYRRRIEAALDGGAGACLLRRPELAAIVAAALRHGDGARYDLQAFVVMPNHVHVLLTQRPGARLAEIVQGWKGWSAKAINRERGTAGSVWQRDYFDRFMRDDRHAAATLAYIENNPVVAGLVAAARDWPFSSASEGARHARHGDRRSPLHDAGGWDAGDRRSPLRAGER